MKSDKHFPDSLSKARKISRFICQELLYDFIENKLDAERRSAVEEYLKSDSEMREELAGMTSAIDYCQSLGATQVSQPVLEKMTIEPSILSYGVKFFNFKKWPESAKWMTEAALISVLVAILGLFIPWEKLPFFQKQESKVILLAKRQNIPILAEQKQVDGKSAVVQKPLVAVAKVAENKVQIKEQQKKIQEDEKEKPISTAKPVSQIVATQFKKAEEKKTNSTKKAQGNAFVYRLFMVDPKVVELTPGVVEKIKSFSGIKAGKVKLGWPKSNGSYFHFSLPEENYEQLIMYLKTIGAVRVEKSAHRRVMPAGTVRVVLWIQNK